MLAPGKKNYDKPRQHIKKQRHYFANKGPSNQGYGFSSSHVWKWELEWAPKNWCFQTVVLEKTLESPLDCKATQSVRPKGNQSWIFIGRTDAVAETPLIWPSDEESQLLGKDHDAGKDWRQKKRETEDEMAGWHHRLSGHVALQSLSGVLFFVTPWTAAHQASLSFTISQEGEKLKFYITSFMGSQRVGHDWVTELNWIGFLLLPL